MRFSRELDERTSKAVDAAVNAVRKQRFVTAYEGSENVGEYMLSIQASDLQHGVIWLDFKGMVEAVMEVLEEEDHVSEE